MKLKDVVDIKLKEGFRVFCKSQENCDECILQKKELIYNSYDQPCEQIYDLLRIIQEK